MIWKALDLTWQKGHNWPRRSTVEEPKVISPCRERGLLDDVNKAKVEQIVGARGRSLLATPKYISVVQIIKLFICAGACSRFLAAKSFKVLFYMLLASKCCQGCFRFKVKIVARVDGCVTCCRCRAATLNEPWATVFELEILGCCKCTWKLLLFIEHAKNVLNKSYPWRNKICY